MKRLQAILGTRWGWSAGMRWSMIFLASFLRLFGRFAHVAGVEWWMRVVFDGQLDRFGLLATIYRLPAKCNVDTCGYASSGSDFARVHHALVWPGPGSHDLEHAHLVPVCRAGKPFKIPAAPNQRAGTG